MAGAQKDVGTPTSAARIARADEQHRPITRNDMLNFYYNWDQNLSKDEQMLIAKASSMAIGGSFLAGFLGKKIANRMSFEHLVKKKILPFPQFPTVARWSISLSFASIPFILVQEWALATVLEMNDQESMLALNTKRFLIMQRGSMMFSRGATREITEEEQAEFAAKAIQTKEGKQVGGARSATTDVNAALGGQMMTPVAQTGYQDFK